jgi:hypothetical protein
MFRKLILSTSVIALLGSAAFAGGISEPVAEPGPVVEQVQTPPAQEQTVESFRNDQPERPDGEPRSVLLSAQQGTYAP